MHLPQFLTAFLAFQALALAAPSPEPLRRDDTNTHGSLPPLTPENFNATDFLTFADPIRATTLGPFFVNLTDEASVNATLANLGSGGGDASSLNELAAVAPAACDFQCQCHLVCTLWIWVIPFYLYCMARCAMP